MITVQTELPEPVFKQAVALAHRENIPIERLIALAATHSIGAWSQDSQIAIRAARASREKFLEALNEVPDAPPLEHDRIPRRNS